MCKLKIKKVKLLAFCQLQHYANEFFSYPITFKYKYQCLSRCFMNIVLKPSWPLAHYLVTLYVLQRLYFHNHYVIASQNDLSELIDKAIYREWKILHIKWDFCTLFIPRYSIQRFQKGTWLLSIRFGQGDIIELLPYIEDWFKE